MAGTTKRALARKSKAVVVTQPERIDHLIDCLAASGNITASCGAARVAVRGFYDWLSRGEGAIEAASLIATREGEDWAHYVKADDAPYVDLVLRVAEARASFVQSCLVPIKVAAPSTWQAAAWLLERQFPDQFALHASRFEKDGQTARPVQIVDDVPSSDAG